MINFCPGLSYFFSHPLYLQSWCLSRPVEQRPGEDITPHRNKYHLWDSSQIQATDIHLFKTKYRMKYLNSFALWFVSVTRFEFHKLSAKLMNDLTDHSLGSWSSLDQWEARRARTDQSEASARCLHASQHYIPALLLITGHEIVNYKFLQSWDNPLNCFQH